MSAITGQNGNVTFATGYKTGVYSWTLDYVSDALESTTFASLGFRDYIPGLRAWSGTYECRLDDTVMIRHPGRPAAYAEFLAHPGVVYTGNIIISGISLGVAVDGVASATFTYQGSGHLKVGGVTTTAP